MILSVLFTRSRVIFIPRIRDTSPGSLMIKRSISFFFVRARNSLSGAVMRTSSTLIVNMKYPPSTSEMYKHGSVLVALKPMCWRALFNVRCQTRLAVRSSYTACFRFMIMGLP